MKDLKELFKMLEGLTYDLDQYIDEGRDSLNLEHEDWYGLITQVANLRVTISNLQYDKYGKREERADNEA